MGWGCSTKKPAPCNKLIIIELPINNKGIVTLGCACKVKADRELCSRPPFTIRVVMTVFLSSFEMVQIKSNIWPCYKAGSPPMTSVKLAKS